MATHYTYLLREGAPISSLFPSGPRLKIIRTHISNIRSETILRPISRTNYMGINGGFFAATDYNQPPTSGRSIAYNADDVGESVSYEGRTLAKNYNYNGTSTTPVSRKTAVIYKDSANNTKVQHVYATSIWDVLNNFNNVQTIIGGTSFTQSDWSSTAYNGPTQRTVFAWRSDGNAYLIITPDAINIPQLRESIEWIGLSPTDAIVLDGSGSSSMRVQVNNSFNESFYGEDRYVFNMIRLINAY